MDIIENPWRGTGLALDDIPQPSTDAAAPEALLARCPAHGQTPMVDAQGVAARMGIAACHVKDERGRMGLGSFKALGAAYVIACDAVAAGGAPEQALTDRCYITASAGNHGLSVAAGARLFGARAVIYLSHTVPEAFADRLRATGAEVVRDGAQYEDSMQAAQDAALANGWTLLSDSSWEGYTALPHRLMEGYLVMAAEATRQISAPTHIFLQAGVGGLAAACAAYFRHVWADGPKIFVVEPEFAPALAASIQAGQSVVTQGPVSDMGRLDCKEPSLIALKGLSRDADGFALISETQAADALPILAEHGLATSASGGAAIAAALADASAFGMGPQSRALFILSETA